MDKIFVFDLDNTLVKTDRANNMAYADAVRMILGVDCMSADCMASDIVGENCRESSLNSLTSGLCTKKLHVKDNDLIKTIEKSEARFTRSELKRKFPSLTQLQLDSVISFKERIFDSYIGETVLNRKLVETLRRLHRYGCRTILLTNAHSRRAYKLCTHYNIAKEFDEKFYYEDHCGFENKYAFLKAQGYDFKDIVLFENESRSAAEAIASGIVSKNIVKINFE